MIEPRRPLNLDLNLLVALDALLTERSVSRAAARRGVGQPAMSASLARLRRHFDDPLLVRDGRGSALTPFAQSLIEPVDRAVIAVERALDRSREFDPARDSRTFTVVASDYVLITLLRPMMAALAELAPRTQIRVVPVTSDYDDLLRREQVDLVIVPSDGVPDGFRHPGRPLFTDRYVHAVDRDDPRVGDAVTLEEMTEMSFASYMSTPSPLIERTLAGHGIERRVAAGTTSFVTTPFLLRGTGLVCFLQERLAREVGDAANLRTLELPFESPLIHEWVFWNARSANDPGNRWLRARMFDLAADYD